MARFLLLKFEPTPLPRGSPVHAEPGGDAVSKAKGGGAGGKSSKSSGRKAAASRKRNAEQHAPH